MSTRSYLPLSARAYFLGVAGLTLLLLVALLWSAPVAKHKIKQAIGLSEAIVAAEDSFYFERVQPIWDVYCVACHDHRKAKGGLRLDSYLYARYSGKSGVAVVPNNAKESAVYARMQLAEDDKKRMPPLGWDHPTKDEQRVIELWLEKGASHTQTAMMFPDAPEQVVEVSIPTFDPYKVESARAQFALEVERLQTQFPFSLNYVARDSALLRFTDVSIKETINDQRFAELALISSQLNSLYLRNTQISDGSLSVLLAMTNLEDLYITGSSLSTESLQTLVANLKQLQRLSVDQSKVTDEIQALCVQRGIKLNEVQSG